MSTHQVALRLPDPSACMSIPKRRKDVTRANCAAWLQSVSLQRATSTRSGGTPIDQGTVAAQRITVSGMRNGKPIIRYRLNWYCITDVDKDWDLRRSGWRLHIEGETPIDINVTFPIAADKVSAAMAGITAYRVINAVPYVCAAEPGIRTTADLPNIVPRMD
jgi:2,4-diaminopentanoate dehydrogenase